MAGSSSGGMASKRFAICRSSALYGKGDLLLRCGHALGWGIFLIKVGGLLQFVLQLAKCKVVVLDYCRFQE